MKDDRTPAQKERQKDVILLVIFAAHELIRNGLATCADLPPMTMSGEKRCHDLIEGGFEPTTAERQSALIFLVQRYGMKFTQAGKC